MIGKVVRGNDVGGLLRYLYGPGRANEHTNPHVVAAWDGGVVADCAPGRDPRLKRLAALLELPLEALDHRPSPSVWHCPMRTAPGDRELSDAEWADVAAEVLHQTGLAPRGDAGGCRWVAVRHADDHIHLAVTLARQDGRQARTSYDYVRLGAACRTVEKRYGLQLTPARDRTAPRRPTRAETEKAARLGLSTTTRQQLRIQVRRAALQSADLDGFLAHLRAAGVEVRLRRSADDVSTITGYAVSSPSCKTAAGGALWFGGGKLSPQLTLPRLMSSWTQALPRPLEGDHELTQPYSLSRSLRVASVIVRAMERGDAVSAASATAALARHAIRHRRP